MEHRNRIVIAAPVCVLGVAGSSAADLRPFASAGQPLRMLVLSDVSAAGQWAAEELARTLARMTKRPVAVTNALFDDNAAIELGHSDEFGGEEHRLGTASGRAANTGEVF